MGRQPTISGTDHDDRYTDHLHHTDKLHRSAAARSHSDQRRDSQLGCPDSFFGNRSGQDRISRWLGRLCGISETVDIGPGILEPHLRLLGPPRLVGWPALLQWISFALAGAVVAIDRDEPRSIRERP